MSVKAAGVKLATMAALTVGSVEVATTEPQLAVSGHARSAAGVEIAYTERRTPAVAVPGHPRRPAVRPFLAS